MNGLAHVAGVHGCGPRTVVFLHGLAGHSGEWDRTRAALGSEFTTVAFDQRGHGASSREPADISREAFVADVVAVRDELGCREPVTLVGQSIGAHTAFLTAAWHPQRVPTTLVLGEHGVLEAARVERMCAARPETARVVIPGAGHDVHLAQPEAWIDTLRRILAGAIE